ncbi:MAG TPA: M23 family metallopeptidase [Thermoanaerobaculia bacterium]|nr:M23 family metallopeptidase [Thermoanaerobaculia bacterium]
MRAICVRKWGGARLGLIGALALLLAGCATIHSAPPAAATVPDDDDFSQLVAQLRSDLSRYNSREVARKPSIAPSTETAKARDREFSERAKALFAPIGSLRMPVVGVRSSDLDDTWHAPRDGGARLHKGIDIFARKGTPVVAVADGIISFIGVQPKGGHSIWLTTEGGTSFYYAHLERWAPGIYEGMEVQAGDLLGFVGNTGNARRTPPHLHFAINQNDEMVNPFPILSRAVTVARARVHVEIGGGIGTR